MAHDWLDQAEKDPRLLAEEALILEVSEEVWAALEKSGMTKADLARALGSSKANVTQLLDGRRNMTLRTLADIGYHLDLEPHFRLCKRDELAEWGIVTIASVLGKPSFGSTEVVEAANMGDWGTVELLSRAKVA